MQESRFEGDDHGFLLVAHHLTESMQHNSMMPLSIKPFQSNYDPYKTPLSSPPDSGPGLDSDELPDIHLAPIQQSQEEAGGECAQRGRHEIVLGTATVVVESLAYNSYQALLSPLP